MSWRTSRLGILARNVGRTLGLNRILARFILGPGYEEDYDRLFATKIREGDVVWDVGANVGYYTSLFADRVGESGRVIAFEPSPHNFSRLTEACGTRSNVTLFNMGLADSDGTLGFEQGADDLGATSRIVDADEATVTVPVRSAESVLSAGEAPAPSVLKIDVEGYEKEVIFGLDAAIAEDTLRVIGIEVHFRILQQRGMPNAAAEIESHLRGSGFSVEWADTSHLIAVRA